MIKIKLIGSELSFEGDLVYQIGLDSEGAVYRVYFEVVDGAAEDGSDVADWDYPVSAYCNDNGVEYESDEIEIL